MIQRPGRTHRCAPTNWFELFIIHLYIVVGEPLAGSLAPAFISRPPVATGTNV